MWHLGRLSVSTTVDCFYKSGRYWRVPPMYSISCTPNLETFCKWSVHFFLCSSAGARWSAEQILSCPRSWEESFLCQKIGRMYEANYTWNCCLHLWGHPWESKLCRPGCRNKLVKVHGTQCGVAIGNCPDIMWRQSHSRPGGRWPSLHVGPRQVWAARTGRLQQLRAASHGPHGCHSGLPFSIPHEAI